MENYISHKSFINTIESKFKNRVHIRIIKRDENRTIPVERLITFCIVIDARPDIAYGVHSLCYYIHIGRRRYRNEYLISDPFMYSGYREHDEEFKKMFSLNDEDESFISLSIKQWLMEFYFKIMLGANVDEFHAVMTLNGENTTVEEWFAPKNES